MKNLPVCVDLFSGLGGFSEAMYQRGWELVRIDNDKGFSHIPKTVIADVLTLTPDDLPKRPDLILASPPCQCFSCASAWRYWNGGFMSPDVKPSIELVKYTLKLISDCRPRYWVLENPRGLLRRVIGLPLYTTYWASWGMPYLKPTDIWGQVPAIRWPKPRNWIRNTHGKHRGAQANKRDLLLYYEKMKDGKAGLLDLVSAPALRSLVPFNFSEALAIAVESDEGGQVAL